MTTITKTLKNGKTISFDVEMYKGFSKKMIKQYIKEGRTDLDPIKHECVDLKFKVFFKGLLIIEFIDQAVIVSRTAEHQKMDIKKYIDNKNLYDIMTTQAVEKIEEIINDFK